jgi:hypothetical protein
MENFIARKYLNYTKIKRIYLSYINNTKKKKKNNFLVPTWEESNSHFLWRGIIILELHFSFSKPNRTS